MKICRKMRNAVFLGRGDLRITREPYIATYPSPPVGNAPCGIPFIGQGYHWSSDTHMHAIVMIQHGGTAQGHVPYGYPAIKTHSFIFYDQ